MASRSAESEKFSKTTMRKITLSVIVFCLLSPSLGDLPANGSSYGLISDADNHSLNTEYVSECSPETVQRLKYERTDLNTRLSYNLLDIGFDLASTIIEFQRQKLDLSDQKEVIRMDCRLIGLCVNTFDLKSIQKAKVANNVGFIVNFISLNEDEMMYIKKGVVNFIQRQSFHHFLAITVIFMNFDSKMISIFA